MLVQKHQKTQQFAVTDMQEKPVDILNGTARASTSTSAVTLLTCVSLQKFPFSSIINFLIQDLLLWCI